MYRKSRITTFTVLKIVLLCISVIGIWYLYKIHVTRKKNKLLLLKLRHRLAEANAATAKRLNFERYFSFRDEQQFKIVSFIDDYLL